MKYFIILFLLLSNGYCLFAQASIFDNITKQEPGKGTVSIRQSWAIRSLVGKQSAEETMETDGNNNFILMPGYRVLVFADNNQRTAKGEAEAKERQINELFNNHPTYVKYNAPFWRLYVGDYITYEEAFSMMCKLNEAFPTFRKEIQIKEEEVKIQLN